MFTPISGSTTWRRASRISVSVAMCLHHPLQGVQTFAVPAGSGAILEFYIPQAGVFPFVDHDKLAFLPFGLALAFSTEGGSRGPRSAPVA